MQRRANSAHWDKRNGSLVVATRSPDSFHELFLLSRPHIVNAKRDEFEFYKHFTKIGRKIEF